MATSSATSDATRELAFQAFQADFTRNGFPVPEGLIRLLRDFTLKPGETAKAGQHRIYRRIWAILWHGSQCTLGKHVASQPTYVYPESLKAVVREIVPGILVDREDPTGPKVYKVNIGDLANAKWPAAKKAKRKN